MTELLTRAEAQKAAILGSIDSWSRERLLFRPAPGSWSALEMLDHIVKSEVGILASARDGVHKPHRIGMRDRVGFLFLDHIFRSERRVKVPASAPSILPGIGLELHDLKERWGETRKDLDAFVRQLSAEQRKLGVFRHPVSGWMTMPQVLRFFSAHLIHHEFQLARIRLASEPL